MDMSQNITRAIRLFALLFLFFSSNAPAQTIPELLEKIKQITSAKNAVVGVAISGNDGKDNVAVNGNQHLPLQSVFKFHIALAVLSEVDKGVLSLQQKIKFEKKDLLPGLYSPIREKYPEGVSLSLSEVLNYTVAQSDNAGCDMLLRMIGGPSVVETYLHKNGFADVSIRINEETQQAHWDRQFENWTTPNAANKTLETFYDNKNKFLSKESHDFLLGILKGTETGQARIKGQLPKNTVVAHKTGSSGTNKEGITAATNDIGIVFLPNGKHFFISVLVSNSKENDQVNEKIIADIAKAAWDYFSTHTK